MFTIERNYRVICHIHTCSVKYAWNIHSGAFLAVLVGYIDIAWGEGPHLLRQAVILTTDEPRSIAPYGVTKQWCHNDNNHICTLSFGHWKIRIFMFSYSFCFLYGTDSSLKTRNLVVRWISIKMVGIGSYRGSAIKYSPPSRHPPPHPSPKKKKKKKERFFFTWINHEYFKINWYY